MKQEKWDIYDKNRINTGNQVFRGHTFQQGQFHLVVHVCVFNSNGEMLIQLRCKDKANWTGQWDFSAGGAAISGEDSQQAAEREILEELGIKLDLSSERPVITIHFDEGKELGFDDYYLVQMDIENDALSLSKRELQCVKWASESDILKMIGTGEFIDFQKCFIQLLFAMNKRKSTHKTSKIV